MLNFWQVIRIALRIPNGKLYAAGTVLGPIAILAASRLISDEKVSMFVMMGLVLVSTICINQFAAYIRAIREEDIRRNDQDEHKTEE